jgi:DNA repair protein RecN (Recombination protein N)
MLLQLKVKDFGIIESLDWELAGGLNVVTGETGAGKSLVIEAIEALLEGKAGDDVIRYGCDRSVIEGVFALSRKTLPRVWRFLEENGLDIDDDTLVVRCEFSRQGRSLVRINGQAVSRKILHELGRLLIDIHGQSQHLSLLDRRCHLDFLDVYGHTMELREEFAAKVAELNRLEQELKSLVEMDRDRARRQEFLRFQIDEIKRANLRVGEDVELEQEKVVLAQAEKLKALCHQAYEALCGDATTPAVDRLNQAAVAIRRLAELDPKLAEQLEHLSEAVYITEDVAQELRSYSQRLEDNPQRLEEVEARLEMIRNLKRKYGQSIEEILDYVGRAEKELKELSVSEERRAELEDRRLQLKREMGELASGLSNARLTAAEKLVRAVKKELEELNLGQVDFRVSVIQQATEDGIPLPDGRVCSFSSDGIDTVEFMVSTNPGEPLKPLAKIASTGEISRFTLALKSALSRADRTPLLIFDEIDIGIGGRSGEMVGKKLWALARDHQVICVTHLPQVAAFADAHYKVEKLEAGSRTVSLLQMLDGDERLGELAAMLAGPDYTEVSLQDARGILGRAASWKQSAGGALK